MFLAVGSGLGVSYALLKHGRMLLTLFLGGNPAGEWKYKIAACAHEIGSRLFSVSWCLCTTPSPTGHAFLALARIPLPC